MLPGEKALHVAIGGCANVNPEVDQAKRGAGKRAIKRVLHLRWRAARPRR